MAIASCKKSSFRAECNAAENHEVLSETKSIKIDLPPESLGLHFQEMTIRNAKKASRFYIGRLLYILFAVIQQSK